MYHVTLCDVEVDYTVDANNVATLVGGRAVPPQSFEDTPGMPERGRAPTAAAAK